MSPRRRAAALAMALLLLAAGGWWAVRAPAMERQSATPLPDIDIDPPALRARRDAALALATMPDDPWTFAESLAASAPASAPDRVADRARCGIDQQPRFADPELRDGLIAADQTAAAGPHYLAARARMDAVLRASADPLDRAVADWLDIGQMRSPSGRVDALVQQAIVSGNAKVYALGLRTCLGSNAAPVSCAALSPRRWAELDPGNGVPWLYALKAARAANDAAAQQLALQQMAASSRFDNYHFAQAAAVASHLPLDERDLAALSDLTVEAVGRSVGDVPPVGTLVAACDGKATGDADRAGQCQAIIDAMFEHTDSNTLRGIAAGLQFGMTGDESRRLVITAERALQEKTWSPATGFSECQQLHDTLKSVLRNGQIGEVEAARERARVFVTP